MTVTAGIMASMASRAGNDSRAHDSIRKRRNSFQMNVYSGTDPVTGRRLYLSESTTDEKKVEYIYAHGH